MVYGAIDLHMRYSQIRIIDDTGTVLRDQRVVTSRERLVQVFDGRGAIRILLETGTESEWVAQTLEAAGHTWWSWIPITPRCTGSCSDG